MINLQSLKETEQEAFENLGEGRIRFIGIRQEFRAWLKNHDEKLEKSIREDERERVVEMVEKQIKGLEFLIKQTAPSEEWKNIARAQINAHKDTLSSLQERQ